MNRPEHFPPKHVAHPIGRGIDGRPPFECIALLLQGGGALGAYQAGVYQALAEEDLNPDWVAGISIGAINAALIAGNPPETRVDKLRSFWEGITSTPTWDWSANPHVPMAHSIDGRKIANQMSAVSALFGGVAGFFTPRMLTPWLQPAGGTKATSYYDTGSLRTTLERLVDFDMINANDTRFSVGAVNVRTGNFVYFDTTTHTIKPEHILASAALPPSKSRANIIGMAVSSPIRRCNGCCSLGRARTPWRSRLTCGVRADNSRAAWLRSRPGKKRSSIRAARATVPPASRRRRRSATPLKACSRNCPKR